MKFEEFAEAYTRDLSDAVVVSDPRMQAARRFDQMFGQVLHDTLMGQEPTTEIDPIGYTNHRERFAALALELLDSDDEDDLQLFQELTFHLQNTSMIFNWLSREHRYTNLTCSQDALALSALDAYKKRYEAIKEGTYFTDALEQVRWRVEGYLHEIDAGIVLCEYAKKHGDMTVVPGPSRFQDKAGRANADFIVLDFENRRALGVQVKAYIASADVLAKYDPERIVFIDGSVDLGGSRTMRIDVDRSVKMRAVAWGGEIAARRVLDIRIDKGSGAKRTGHKSDLAQGVENMGYILRAKRDFRAAQALEKAPFTHAVKMVDERIGTRFSELARRRMAQSVAHDTDDAA